VKIFYVVHSSLSVFAWKMAANFLSGSRNVLTIDVIMTPLAIGRYPVLPKVKVSKNELGGSKISSTTVRK